MGRLAHGLPPQRVAQRSKASEATRNITNTGGSASDVTPSAATGAAVEPVRALQAVVFSDPASGVAGGRGGDLAGASDHSDVKRSATQRRE